MYRSIKYSELLMFHKNNGRYLPRVVHTYPYPLKYMYAYCCMIVCHSDMPGIRTLGRGWNTKNRVREEWTDTWLSIKSSDVGDTVDRGFKSYYHKPTVNSVLAPRSVVFNFASFDRQSSICSLFPHPVLSAPPASKVSEYPACPQIC